MNTTIVTSSEELRRILAEVAVEAVQKVLPGLVKDATAKENITQEELRELTGWNNRKIQYLRSTAQIAFTATGRKALYERQSVLDYLRAHRVKSRA